MFVVYGKRKAPHIARTLFKKFSGAHAHKPPTMSRPPEGGEKSSTETQSKQKFLQIIAKNNPSNQTKEISNMQSINLQENIPQPNQTAEDKEKIV